MQSIDYDGDFPRFGTRNYAGGISIFRNTDILLFIAKIKGLFPLAVVQARSQRAVEITRAEERIKENFIISRTMSLRTIKENRRRENSSDTSDRLAHRYTYIRWLLRG